MAGDGGSSAAEVPRESIEHVAGDGAAGGHIVGGGGGSSTSSSSSSSDSDTEIASGGKSGPKRIFGREKPVHSVLGGGKSADVILWRNKKISGGVLAAATAVWVIFELLEYRLLTLACQCLLICLAVLFLWSKATTLINKAPPRLPEFAISEDTAVNTARAIRFEFNRASNVLREIASGRELKKFLGVIAALWILSVVGSWCNFLSLLYIVFVLVHIVPVLYEKYEDQVDTCAEKAIGELKKQHAVLDAKVLSKIPKNPLKDKKQL